ncbi:MAG: hypothetical protein GY943_05895 [Chloroflexi bacterium]|nr:hypothetical protein [Chloroflexota bacterium]
MKSTKKKFDDLTVLTGIGEERQAFIRKHLDVYTYQDLASLSAEEIAAAFKAGGKRIPLKVIIQFLKETELEAQEAAQANNTDEWEWLDKSFVVEFRVSKENDDINNRQSRIYFVKVDKHGVWLDNGEKTPVVKKGNELYAWMLEQLGETVETWEDPEEASILKTIFEDQPEESKEPLEESIEEPATIVAHPTIDRLEQIEIREIRILDPLDSRKVLGIGEKGEPFRGSLQSDQPFLLEVTFNLPELADVNLNIDINFRVDFFVRNQKNRASVGATKPLALTAGQVDYTAQLPNVYLSAGIYYLGVIVYIQSRPPSANYLEVPQLHVY